LPFSLASTSSYGGVFNGSAQNLTTSTNASLALGTSNFTIEYWANITTNTGGITLVTSGNGTTTYDGLFGYQTGSAGLLLYLSSTGSSWDIANGVSIGSFGSTGKWNHIAITRSGSNFYTFVNGIPTTTFTSSASIYQSANSFAIGRAQAGSSLTGIVSNLRVVVGTALYTSAFTPSTTPLTAVTNTKLLTLQDSTFIDNSTNALTITNTGSVTSSVQYPFVGSVFNDASGNNNGWTGNNISITAGATYDSMTDVPTLTSATAANFAVLNPIGGSTGTNITVTNGNLTATTPIASVSSFFKIPSSISVSSGKWYFEDTVTALDANNWALSISGTAPLNDSSNQNGLSSGEVTYVAKNNSSVEQIFDNGSSTYTGGSGASAGDVIGVAFDVTNLTVQFYRNNTAVSTAQAITSATFFYISAIVRNNTTASTHNINFGQRPFSYTPPSGFVALNTYNLPASTVPNGASYMAATLWTGNGATNRTIANTVGSASFQPDLVWTKGRNATWQNFLQDSVRGAANFLISDTTGAETTTSPNIVSSFASNGFVIQNNGNSNNNGDTYVGWNWKAGGTAVSNTSGSITSSVSANTTSGCSVVTYTGTGANATVGHGLGVAPSMIIVKTRSVAANDWRVYHVSLGATKYINLNEGLAAAVYALNWNNTEPTSSVFTIGTNSAVNTSAGTYVAYCFAPIKGFSAFGSYTGNASADGPFVYTGFRPRWIMLKNSSEAYDWYVFDTSRNTYNLTNISLYPDLSIAEGTSSVSVLDVLSNGFKMRGASGGTNPVSTSTMIYAAFAENPFQNSLAR
jgi:hypothetical protein